MKITVTCAGCGKQYEVDDAYAGKSGKCSTCGQRMTIPGTEQAGATQSAEPESYQLEDAHDRQQPSSFTPSRGAENDEQPPRQRRKKKKSPRRPATGVGGVSSKPSSTCLAVLIGFACVVAMLVVVAIVMPTARMNIGRIIVLAGLVVFLYGYGSGCYIAFTEDDLYGWLYLIFPPYAAYYFVSRWDEMRSRLVMLVVGLALLTGGGRLLEANRPAADTDEAAKQVGDRAAGAQWPIVAARRDAVPDNRQTLPGKQAEFLGP